MGEIEVQILASKEVQIQPRKSHLHSDGGMVSVLTIRNIAGDSHRNLQMTYGGENSRSFASQLEASTLFCD